MLSRLGYFNDGPLSNAYRVLDVTLLQPQPG